MRWLVLLALVGCGEQSVANGIDVGVGGASGSQETDGGAGGTAAGGSGGMAVDAGLSCSILATQVSGMSSAVHTTSNNDISRVHECGRMTATIQIIQGTYFDSSWTLSSYSASPSSIPGLCEVAFTFSRTTTACGAETLYAPLTVPGI